MALDPLPPLLGDDKGRFRVQIVGNSGVGKTTTGRELASILKVKHISLDSIQFQPGWIETPKDEFQAVLKRWMDEAEGSWVIDGNYESKIGTMVLDSATHIIWLDPPFLLYFPRLLWRTFLRLLRLEAPCSPGCEENPAETFFSKDSIVWWCITNHRRIQATYWPRLLAGQTSAGDTSDNSVYKKMRRIGGWGGALKEWLDDVRDMVGGK